MLDKSNSDYFNSDRLDTSYASSENRNDSSNSQANERSREDNLQRREGKSATRTVKQAMAIKHLKALKNAHD